MKNQRNSKNDHIKIYRLLEETNQIEDTRYWGLFKRGERIMIDPIRYQKEVGNLSDDQIEVMSNRTVIHFSSVLKRLINWIRESSLVIVNHHANYTKF